MERPPSIILTTIINILTFQVDIKAIANGSFDVRDTSNGIRIMAREKADYSAIMSHLGAGKLPYYTYHPKILKNMKAVIRPLPGDTPAEDITNELMALGFTIISVRQMSTSR